MGKKYIPSQTGKTERLRGMQLVLRSHPKFEQHGSARTSAPVPSLPVWDSSPACRGPHLQDRPTTATEILPPADPGRKGRGWIYELCRQRSDRTERYLAVPVPAEPGRGRIRGWQQEAAEGTGVRLGLSGKDAAGSGCSGAAQPCMDTEPETAHLGAG